MAVRKINQIITPQVFMEGAGVRVRRSIATRQVDNIDPFLLFDHMGSENPDDFLKGFPMHPHRGIETVSYVLEGAVTHRDSIGNAGSIGAGDVQWMTSGRGILHEEMPQQINGRMDGFQLWVNLPAKLKMSQPGYQEFLSKEIPEIVYNDGTKIRVIAGQVDDVTGPVTEIAIRPIYLDVSLPAQSEFSMPTEKGHTVLAYIFKGEGIFGKSVANKEQFVSNINMVVYEKGESVQIRTTDRAVRFLLLAGKPLNEPIARWGPFVMNTMDEIQQTLLELENGTFIRD